MLAVLPSSSMAVSPLPSPLALESKQLGLMVVSLADSISQFTSLIIQRATRPTVRLFCSYPTECCTDLQDLQSLHARAFETVHAVVASLRASKIHATYSLCPSAEAVVVLSAEKQIEGLTGMGGRDEVRVGDIGVPVLIIS